MTSFPAVLQDIAVVVGEETRAAAVVDDGPLRRRRAARRRSELFDVYRGEQVGEGEKSLALRLAFRAPDRTLTDAEVAERRAAIEAALARDRRAAACLSTGLPWLARLASAARCARTSSTSTRRWS